MTIYIVKEESKHDYNWQLVGLHGFKSKENAKKYKSSLIKDSGAASSDNYRVTVTTLRIQD